MRIPGPILVIFLTAAASVVVAEEKTPLRANLLLDGGQVLLPNGWKISPAGHATKLPGDMPMRIVLAPDGKRVLVNTGGYNEHGISVLDATTGELLQHVKVPRTFVGMCFDAGGSHVYLSGGQTRDEEAKTHGAEIHRFRWTGSGLTEDGVVLIQGLNRDRSFITGLASGADGSLYVANINEDCVYRIKPEDGKMLATAKVGYRPCAIAFSPDGKILAVANWGGASVSLLDPETMMERGRAVVGSHPSDILWAPDGRLFVSNAG